MAHFIGKWRARSARQIKERYHRLSSSYNNVSSPLHSPKSVHTSQHQLADTVQNRMKEILRLAASPSSQSHGPGDEAERRSVSNRSSGDDSDNLMIPSLDVMDFDAIGLFGEGEEAIPMDMTEQDFSSTQDTLASSQILPSAVNSQVSETETEVNISAEDSAKDQFSSQFSHLSPMQVLTNIQLDTSPSDMVDSVSVRLERNTAASVAPDSINLAIGEQMTTST